VEILPAKEVANTKRGRLLSTEKFITSFGTVEAARLSLYYYLDRAINRTKGNAVIDAPIVKLPPI
jgi:hypothetical protein